MLRRRAPVIVLAVVIGVVGGLVFSHFKPKRYESTAELPFRPLLLDVQVTELPLLAPSAVPQREAATNLALVSLDDVRMRAAARLGPRYGFSKLLESAVSVGESASDHVFEVPWEEA